MTNNPHHGGSYTRDADGKLTRVEGPAVETQPGTTANTQKSDAATTAAAHPAKPKGK